MLTKTRLNPILSLAAAALLTMTLAACQTSGPAVRPSLPVAPADFGRPVKVPDLTKGEDARAGLAETRGALAKANGRLTNDAAFYGDVVKNFSN